MVWLWTKKVEGHDRESIVATSGSVVRLGDGDGLERVGQRLGIQFTRDQFPSKGVGQGLFNMDVGKFTN